MPLPVLNTVTYEPTGTFLPLDSYFNPTVNTNYRARGTDLSRRSLITLGTYIDIAKNILTPESFDDIMIYTRSQYNMANDDLVKSFSKTLYDCLPDEHKWLALNTYSSLPRTANGTDHFWKIFLHKVNSTDYNELSVDSVEVRLNLTATPEGSWVTSDEQINDFKQRLAEVAGDIAQSYANHALSQVYSNDARLNLFVLLAYRYANNTLCFYPIGNSNCFPGNWDWTTPSSVAEYARDDAYRIKISLHPHASRLQFQLRPTQGNRTALSRVLNYSTNVLDYLPYSIKGSKEGAAPLYGVELEACSNYEPAAVIAAQKDLFFILKQDGSISGQGRHRYEMVTVPASLKAHKRLWAEFFEKVDYTQFDTSKATGNGMHVHIGRKDFTTQHLNRFTWFITSPSHTDFMLAVSERPSKSNFDQWAALPVYTGIRSKHQACKQASLMNIHIRGAVHFKGDKTVEVRMFKGIVSYATIVKNLEFVDSVFHYTQHTALNQLGIDNYLAWLNRTPANKYQMLKSFLAEIKTADFIAYAEVNDFVWFEPRDFAIAEKLNKAPFVVTNAHITALNKKRRKRTFILKNGKVTCVVANGGLLAKLDKSVQQKQTRGAAIFSMTEFAA